MFKTILLLIALLVNGITAFGSDIRLVNTDGMIIDSKKVDDGHNDKYSLLVQSGGPGLSMYFLRDQYYDISGNPEVIANTFAYNAQDLKEVTIFPIYSEDGTEYSVPQIIRSGAIELIYFIIQRNKLDNVDSSLAIVVYSKNIELYKFIVTWDSTSGKVKNIERVR